MTSAPALRVLACALLAATAHSVPRSGQAQQGAGVRLVTPGSFAADSARLASITSDSSLAYSLLRSASTLTPQLPGRRESSRTALILPEIYSINNSALPYSLNDGSLWAGRGRSLMVRAGFSVAVDRLRLVVAPEFSRSENAEFAMPPSWVTLPRPPGRSEFSSPWHTSPESIDLPVRFGSNAFSRWDYGQSTLDADLGRVTLGFSTENEWWGPGIRNAIVMSTNAAGIPRLFVRTTRPVVTRIGTFEARLFAGALRESPYFDTTAADNWRSLSALAATWTPPHAPNITIGLSRAVYAPVSSWTRVPTRLLDAVLRNPGRPNNHLPGDTVVVPGPDQVFSLFGRWALPAGVEVYAEWGRNELPTSLRDFLTAPNHTQGYTLGLQWAQSTGTGSVARIQLEATYLEKSATLRDRPVGTWYTSRAVAQGYTNRGKVIGASIGPGASSQWVAVDYFAPLGYAGLFLSRIRWDAEALYTFPSTDPAGNKYCSHDTSLLFGVRGGLHSAFGLLEAGYSVDLRRNVFFEQGGPCGHDFSALRDETNSTFEIRITPP